MRNNVFFLLSLGLMTFIYACKKKETPTQEHKIRVNAIPFYGATGNSILNLDSVYQTPEDYLIKFTDIKFFLTNVTGTGADVIESCLFDYRSTAYDLLEMNGKPEDYSNLTGTIGVDSSLNHLDPTLFPIESALNIENSGLMHWGWNTGYVFILIEGKADTLVDGIENLDLNFSYHVGTDLFQKPLQINGLTWNAVSDSQSEANIKIDLYKMFHTINPIDLKSEFLTHSGAGQKVLAEKVAENFKLCLTPL